MDKIKVNSYKDLLVWQKAIDISVEVYKVTMNFPSTEIYGLTNQVRRASNSISLNIAEGFGRNSNRSFINFLNIASASLYELESGLYLSERLNFITNKELETINFIITEESKMLSSLISKLKLKNNDLSLSTNH
jgi:four helix bundle protein